MDGIGQRDGAAQMRDHNELFMGGNVLEESLHGFVVGIIQRRLDFI
jgi:hypothetical protein